MSVFSLMHCLWCVQVHYVEIMIVFKQVFYDLNTDK